MNGIETCNRIGGSKSVKGYLKYFVGISDAAISNMDDLFKDLDAGNTDNFMDVIREQLKKIVKFNTSSVSFE